jgi:hypothetical protein
MSRELAANPLLSKEELFGVQAPVPPESVVAG